MANRKKTNRKEQAADMIKEILKWIVVTAGAFAYWILVLLLASLFLLHIWHTSLEQIVVIGSVLGALTSAVYLGWLIYQKRK